MSITARQINLVSILTASLVFIGSANGGANARVSTNLTTAKTNGAWSQYLDPKFGFTVDYPADWAVSPRPDSDNGTGVLTFASPKSIANDNKTGHQHEHGENASIISVGFYSYSIDQAETLEDWMNVYPDEAKIKSRRGSSEMAIDDGEVRAVEGESEITKFRYVNIRHGDVVWFIWGNFNSSSDKANNVVFEKITKSFKFGKAKLKNLRALQGEAKPLREVVSNLKGSSTSKLNKPTNQVPSLNGNWWAPVLGAYTVECGSGYHTGAATYAADTAGGQYGLSVKSVYDADNIDFNGWDNSGYGNLIILRSAGNQYRQIYAHLSVRNGFPYTNYIGRDTEVGKVGNTGGVQTHLHHHIRTSGYQAVNLTGMYGFSPNGYYPSTYATCGYMGR